MKYYTLRVTRGLDGLEAVFEVFPESATWAANEDGAIACALERLAYFLGCESTKGMKVEFSRKDASEIWYRVTVQ